MTHILMIAAENDALPGGKVGGIGDVVRDAPIALAERHCTVTVLTPAYGVFSGLPEAQHLARVEVRFGTGEQVLDLYEVAGRQTVTGVRHYVLDHPAFSVCGNGRIYCDDPAERPFATDAGKFALFCAGAAKTITQSLFDDTVFDNVNGFALSGSTPNEQADQLVNTVQRAISLYFEQPKQWQVLCREAAAARFRWTDSIDAYLNHLYRQPSHD